MLNNKKTYIGGAGGIMVGIGMLLNSWYTEVPVDWNVAMGWIIGGWSLIGFRHAYEKK